jgi:hypothetical protein
MAKAQITITAIMQTLIISICRPREPAMAEMQGKSAFAKLIKTAG